MGEREAKLNATLFLMPMLIGVAAAVVVPWLHRGGAGADLRGRWTLSDDHGTYLVIDDDNGGHCGTLFVDRREWSAHIHATGAIAPGRHQIRCGTKHGDEGIEFNVPQGAVYHFNYWGP